MAALAKGFVNRPIAIVAGDNKVADGSRVTDETNSGGDNLTIGLERSGISDVVAASEVARHLTASAKGQVETARGGERGRGEEEKNC
jgi:hypothetical protein